MCHQKFNAIPNPELARLRFSSVVFPVLRQISENAGFDGSVVVDKIKNCGKIGYGFDAYNEVYCDMMEAGIVDPTKVTRSALQNAASVASTVLTTEAVVADKKEENPVPPPQMNGGMGGMY